MYICLEDLDQLKNLKICFAPAFFIIDWYLFQLIVLLKQDANFLITFTLSSVGKVTAGTLSIVSVIVNLICYSTSD